MDIYFRETRQQGQILMRSGDQRQYWGTKNIFKLFFIFICGETDRKTDSFHRTQEKVTTGTLEVLKRTCLFEIGSYAGINHIQMHVPENV